MQKSVVNLFFNLFGFRKVFLLFKAMLKVFDKLKKNFVLFIVVSVITVLAGFVVVESTAEPFVVVKARDVITQLILPVILIVVLIELSLWNVIMLFKRKKKIFYVFILFWMIFVLYFLVDVSYFYIKDIIEYTN